MHRAQIIIEDWQYETLKSMARREGMSISALVRRILDRSLGHGRRSLVSIRGIAHAPDLSGREHDEIIYGP